MKTLTIVVPKPMQQGQAHYRIPLKAGTGPVPSLQLLIGKKTEVPLADQAHEDLLRADRNLEVLDEDGKHDKSEVDELEAVIKKLPPNLKEQLERAVREAEQDMRDELEKQLDKQAAAIAETKRQLEEAIAKQSTIVKENTELRAALEQSNKERVELEAKLKAPAPTPPVDEKAAKDAKPKK